MSTPNLGEMRGDYPVLDTCDAHRAPVAFAPHHQMGSDASSDLLRRSERIPSAAARARAYSTRAGLAGISALSRSQRRASRALTITAV
jgi:hypothetical protein